jgi:hypothetical protein
VPLSTQASGSEHDDNEAQEEIKQWDPLSAEIQQSHLNRSGNCGGFDRLESFGR